MTTQEDVLPAGSGELNEDLFPMRQRRRLRDNFGLAIREFRQTPPFASIERGRWAVFIAIACSWQSNAEAWPTQETIAAFCGYTTRAVQDFIHDLERRGFIRLRRQRFRDGGDRLYYAPGHTTLAALIAFIERYPNDWTNARATDEPGQLQPLLGDVAPVATAPLEPAAPLPPETIAGGPPEASSATLPEAVSLGLSEASSGRLPEAISVKPREKLKEPSSWRAEPSSTEHADCKEEQAGLSELTGEDREIAQTVLAERLKRKHPGRKPPKLFEADDIDLVASCSRAIEGDREAKLQAHREALEGAYLVSKDGPPSARFIWGKVEHFLDHAERGRRKLRADERSRRPRSDAAVAPQAPRVVRVEIPAISDEQMAFQRLFGDVGDSPTSNRQRNGGTE